jgi:20S proteasome subunit alpha 5
MFDENTMYDYGVNTFSPEGRIYQIEYAINASKLGSSGLGIACDSGVVLAVEKRKASKLIERSGFEKVNTIDSHIMCLVSGLVADAQELLEHARSEAHYHRFVYDTPMDIKPLT